LREGFSALALRRAFYVFGIDNCRSALLLAAPDAAIVRTAFITVAAWQNPVFPLRGEDMIKLGIPAGPRIGQILQAVEEWWIAGDFLADREACLAQAKIYGKVP
jgi:poly(A) polymerase